MPASQPHRRVVILGGGYAGLTAAARLGEAAPDANVTLVDAKAEFVERIRLHEVSAGSHPRPLAYAPLLATRHVKFVQAHIDSLHPNEHAVEIVDPAGGRSRITYDYLVYALGSRTNRAMVPGGEQHAVSLDTVDGAAAIARLLASRADRGRLLIVGGGLTAIEAAAEFAERMPSLEVSIAVGNTFGPGSGPGGLSRPAFDHIEAVFNRLNIRAHRARVVALEAGRAQLSTCEALPFDLCLWCTGFIPSPIAGRAALAVTPTGQIRTDMALRSINYSDIIAAGDAADVEAEPAGKCRMSCATGRPMGEAAARTVLALLAGLSPPTFRFGYAFRCISLGRADGVIQFVDEADRPLDEVWTGARGARWKEYICRRTLNGIGLDPDLGPAPDTPPPRS